MNSTSPVRAPVTLRFDVINVFDTSYVIRNGTGIGVFANQYGPRRGYYVGLAQLRAGRLCQEEAARRDALGLDISG